MFDRDLCSRQFSDLLIDPRCRAYCLERRLPHEAMEVNLQPSLKLMKAYQMPPMQPRLGQSNRRLSLVVGTTTVK
jgi:hypothetical protein